MVMTAEATAGGGDECPLVDTGLRQNQGINREDISHRGEGGKPGNYFTGWGGTMFFQGEETIEHAS